MNWHNKCNFGMHFDLHASESDTELGAEITHENLKESIMLMNPDWVQCDCKGHPGYTAWPTKYGYMAKGVKKNAMRIYADVCKELGIPLGMHYSGVIDTKACIEHPDWEALAPKSADGVAQGYSPSQKSVCPHSAYYDELMIPQMLELIEDYDVDGFWVDGDCWGVLPCYCDKCSSDFKAKFGIEPPVDKKSPEWRLWNDYHRGLFLDNVKKYTDAVHAKKPECMVISNWMLTFGAPVEDNLNIDYISGDLSHNQGLKSAVLEGHFIPNRNRDWDLMVWAFMSNEFGAWTQKTVPHLTQECAYIIACGGAAMIYETPQRNGLFVDWHAKDYRKVSDFIKLRGDVSRFSKSIPQIAVIHNPNDYWEETYEGVYAINLLHPAMKKFVSCGGLLSGVHYHYDFVMPSMVKGKLSDYKLVIIPEVYMFDEDFKKELSDYVENGGNVLITGLNGTKTFADLLGVNGENISEDGVFVQSGQEVTTFHNKYTIVQPKKAKVYRYIMNHQIIGFNETENPAITINEYGKGKVVGVYFDMFNSNGNTNYPRNRRLFNEIIGLFDIEFMLSDIDAPYYVHFNLREKDNKYIINLNNVGKVTQATDLPNVDMVEEIPTVQKIKFKVKLDKEPKYVDLVPNRTNLITEYKDGYLFVEIKNFEIMESLVIEK